MSGDLRTAAFAAFSSSAAYQQWAADVKRRGGTISTAKGPFEPEAVFYRDGRPVHESPPWLVWLLAWNYRIGQPFNKLGDFANAQGKQAGQQLGTGDGLSGAGAKLLGIPRPLLLLFVAAIAWGLLVNAGVVPPLRKLFK